MSVELHFFPSPLVTVNGQSVLKSALTGQSGRNSGIKLASKVSDWF